MKVVVSDSSYTAYCSRFVVGDSMVRSLGGITDGQVVSFGGMTSAELVSFIGPLFLDQFDFSEVCAIFLMIGANDSI